MPDPGTLGLSGPTPRESTQAGDLVRNLVIGLMAFLTVVDLFATQAILPSLARAYAVSPAAIGFAVNATTLGMALGGLGVALLGPRIDRRRGVVVSLLLLAIPTALLGTLPDLWLFAALRVLQGICMAAATTASYLAAGTDGLIPETLASHSRTAGACAGTAGPSRWTTISGSWRAVEPAGSVPPCPTRPPSTSPPHCPRMEPRARLLIIRPAAAPACEPSCALQRYADRSTCP
ncbi:MFS transporter [Methylobacterium nodulans]|uniref:Major facilitator superfamily (MFS) profile domain-containing protein n=1 Tax=Methylobacterium nodulans (strain LMG 21967 / CNCM I-2342 / ORS 2060) TaxID=460265 RepID=B8IHG0_METNO|nr:hypothetical protein Mnod_6878 [Methylobacterium nodulans ORS 2060]